MNWEALAAIGEILGATAVLVTIAYLAVQVRQNTASVATATWESVLTGFNEINVAVANNPELADVVTRGMYDPDSLTDMVKHHQPSDDTSLPIHYPSAARLAKLNAAIGRRVGDAEQKPSWKEGDFFGRTFGGQ